MSEPLSPITPPGWLGGAGAPAGGPDEGATDAAAPEAEAAPDPAVEHASNVAELEQIANTVNPGDGTVNCGKIIDAVIAQETGTDPDATAETGRNGDWSDIEGRHDTDFSWGSSFDDAYQAVEQGGDGTIAVVGIGYSGGGSHVVAMVNHDGTVGIVEGQDWGASGGREVITTTDRANERYNSDGGSNIGWGIVGSDP